MKIFLSYASEDRAEAELIAGSIRARGHRVFFDQTDLPAGETYEDQIETAINSSEMLVFLVSSASVAKGKFTLTELGFARKKWPNTKGSVLPVMIRPTPMEDVPPYLRTVTILTPEGNIAAETAAAVQQLKWHSGRLIRRAAVAGVALAAAGSLVWYFTPPKPDFSVNMSAPRAFEKGIFGSKDIYNIVLKATNQGGAGGQITESTFDVDPPEALVQVDKTRREPEIVAPGAVYTDHILVKVDDPTARFRTCVHVRETRQSCSGWRDWNPQGDFLYGDAFDVGDDLRTAATAIAWADNAFLIAAASPNKVVRMTEDGTRLAEADLPGMPVSISTGSLGVFIGLTAPNAIARLDPSSLVVMETVPVAFPEDADHWGEPVSNRPASLAQDGERLWVLARGGASTAGLGYFTDDLSDFTVPPYYQDVSFDLTDMRLRNGAAAVWSGQNGTTPTSVHRFSAETHTPFSGHQFDIASCASDVLPTESKELLLPDCDGVVWRVAVNDSRLDQLDRIDGMVGYNSNPDSWEEVLLDEAEAGRYVGILTQRTSGPAVMPEEHVIRVSALDWPTGSKLVFSVDSASVLDVASGTGTFLLLLESDKGQRQLAAPSYQ